MKQPIRIIALDLDGTLLTTDKKLSDGNREALARAAAAGVEIVPTTGRFYNGIPEVIRELPFLHYVITVNGAEGLDLQKNTAFYKEEMTWERALDVMRWLDQKDVIYDCCIGGVSYMTAHQREDMAAYMNHPMARRFVYEWRTPVEDLKTFVQLRKHGVQKIQMITRTPEVRRELLDTMAKEFGDICVVSSVPKNVEVTSLTGNKGDALMALADYLGVDRSATMSFGDGLNDLSMLTKAGVGVAMGNAFEEVKEQVAYITDTNDNDGVAKGIARFVFGEE